jgi:hypothetical protein
MAETIRTTLNPDNKPGEDTEVHLPPGITESEALALARRRVWALHRDLVVRNRMERTRKFLAENPALDQALAEIGAGPNGWEQLKRAFEPFRQGYSKLDPIDPSTH